MIYLKSFEKLFGNGHSICRSNEVTSSDSFSAIFHHGLHHLQYRKDAFLFNNSTNNSRILSN